LEQLLRRLDAASTAELQRRFDSTADSIDRQKIAVALVERLQEDDRYFDFLAKAAQAAVRSDMPFPYPYDEQGRSIGDRYSQDFLAWAAKRKIPPDTAARAAERELPLAVFMLALTSDPRAAEILEQGLWSKNPHIVYRAALGLARLRRESAVPAIIAAAEQAPRDAGQLIAQALVLFASEQAQAAAERIIGDRRIVEALRAHAEEELNRRIGDF
jgi:hypothetical protein